MPRTGTLYQPSRTTTTVIALLGIFALIPGAYAIEPTWEILQKETTGTIVTLACAAGFTYFQFSNIRKHKMWRVYDKNFKEPPQPANTTSLARRIRDTLQRHYWNNPLPNRKNTPDHINQILKEEHPLKTEFHEQDRDDLSRSFLLLLKEYFQLLETTEKQEENWEGYLRNLDKEIPTVYKGEKYQITKEWVYTVLKLAIKDAIKVDEMDEKLFEITKEAPEDIELDEDQDYPAQVKELVVSLLHRKPSKEQLEKEIQELRRKIDDQTASHQARGNDLTKLLDENRELKDEIRDLRENPPTPSSQTSSLIAQITEIIPLDFWPEKIPGTHREEGDVLQAVQTMLKTIDVYDKNLANIPELAKELGLRPKAEWADCIQRIDEFKEEIQNVTRKLHQAQEVLVSKEHEPQLTIDRIANQLDLPSGTTLEQLQSHIASETQGYPGAEEMERETLPDAPDDQSTQPRGMMADNNPGGNRMDQTPETRVTYDELFKAKDAPALTDPENYEDYRMALVRFSDSVSIRPSDVRRALERILSQQQGREVANVTGYMRASAYVREDWNQAVKELIKRMDEKFGFVQQEDRLHREIATLKPRLNEEPIDFLNRFEHIISKFQEYADITLTEKDKIGRLMERIPAYLHRKILDIGNPYQETEYWEFRQKVLNWWNNSHEEWKQQQRQKEKQQKRRTTTYHAEPTETPQGMTAPVKPAPLPEACKEHTDRGNSPVKGPLGQFNSPERLAKVEILRKEGRCTKCRGKFPTSGKA